MNQNLRTVLIISVIIVAILIILSVVIGYFWVGQGDGYGMMGPGMMEGFGFMFLMPIVWIVVLGLIIWAVVTAIHSSRESDSTAHKTDSPLEILKRRYAQGEIDKEEYQEKKKDLL